MLHVYIITLFFFFNDPPTTEIYPFSLHDAFPIFHKMWSLTGKDCNCADFSRHAALNAKRLPGITRLVFRDTVAVLTRMTDAGLIDDTGNRPASIHENQTVNPSDGGIGAYSWPKPI